MSKSENPVAPKWVGDRFRLLKVLKEGSSVNTYLGVDVRSQQEVVIKVANSDAPAGVMLRLEHEAEVLKNAKSPYLPSLSFSERTDHELLLVMPFVRGMSLESRLKSGPLSVFRTLAVARCILLALEEVHANAVIHRDIKPANIIFPEPFAQNEMPVIGAHFAELTQKAVLIDFGFARSTALDISLRDLSVGTVRYMSPEQAGLLSDPVGDSTDLYSLGLVLFECLTGSPVFSGVTVGEVLRQQLSQGPPRLRDLGPHIPRALDEILHRMVRKAPQDRYQSAAAVLGDIKDLIRALESGDSNPQLVVGTYDHRVSLAPPTFVGRSEELQKLDEHLDHLKKGKGGFVFIESESGGGKTRLLDEMASRASASGVRVIRGQGLDQAAVKPLQILDGVVSSILEMDPNSRVQFRQRMGEKDRAIVTVLPGLSPLFEIGDLVPLGQEAHGETRSLIALARLLDSLGDSDRPALLILDDCQWVDEMTLKMLEYWNLSHGGGNSSSSIGTGVGRYVSIVVVFRSEDVKEDHSLRRLHMTTHLKLPPFGSEDIRNLIESMAGPLPKEAVQMVIQFAEGSPFFAAAVLQGLVEAGALVQAEGAISRWKVQPQALANVQSSRQAAAFLSHRLDLFSPEVMNLLSAGATLGNRFDLEFAARLAGQTPSQAVPAAQDAHRKHVIWFHGGDQAVVVFVHDKLREAFLSKIPEVQKKALHLRAAKLLELQDPNRFYEISFHYGAAEAFDLALPFAIRAAKDARSQHALEIAEHHYRIAGRGLSQSALGASHEAQAQNEEALGEVLMLRGHYEGAMEAFSQASQKVEGKVSQARLDGKIGELAFKRGDMKVATEALERALRRLGHPVPKYSALFLPLVLGEILVQALHTLLPIVFVGRKTLSSDPELAEIPLLRVRLYSRLTYCYFFQRGAVPTLWSHLKELNLAEKYPPSKELGQAFSTHAPVMTMLPYFSRAIAYGKKGIEVRRALGDLWGEAQALHFYGAALFGASRLAEAKEIFKEALRLLERTGDQWEINGCTYHLAFCYYRMGDIKGAIEMARRAHEAGLAIGDSFASGASLNVWSKASEGNIPVEAITTELRRASEDKQRNAEVLQAEGIRLLASGNLASAVETLGESWALVKKAGLRTEYIASIPIWLASALRRHSESISTWNPKERSRLLREALRASTEGLGMARFYRNNLPHALREHALVLALANKPNAWNYLCRSLEVARLLGMQFEYLQTLYARAQIGNALGWHSAAEDLAQLKLAFESDQLDFVAHRFKLDNEQPEPVTLSILDRFDMIVDIGKQITGGLTQGGITHRIQNAAVTLLRGDHCLIIEAGKDAMGSTEYMIATGDQKVRFSRTLVARALSEGKPVTLDGGFGHNASESFLLSGTKSAICVPIYIRGVANRCLYVTHHQVGELFGEEEEKLAGFIAALAGSALENAEGFNEIQALSRSLEQDIVAKAKAEENLQSSLKEKEVLLGEVYHRTKNNMQVISSLLSLQSQYVKDPSILGILKENQNRIRSMALVHEKLYQSKDLVNLKFKDYIQGLVQGLVSSYGTTNKRISLVTRIEDIQIGIDSAIPCGLIINELVTNSLKYAFPKSELTKSDSKESVGTNTPVGQQIARDPRIEITLKLLSPEIELVISDNGVGLGRDFDFEKVQSLGLKLVKGLVEKQLSGRLEVKREVGTAFLIHFKEVMRKQHSDYQVNSAPPLP